MNGTSGTDWAALEAMSDEEAYANALADPDAQPGPVGPEIDWQKEEGATILERFRKALAKENKVSLTVRYDADIVRYYKAKGKGYQAAMNAALRACMEAEQERASHA